MTQITRDDVQSLARLSSLELTEEEIQKLLGDIPNIVAYINQLDELDTDGIEPTYQVNYRQNEWREDVAEPSIDTTDLLALAPEFQDDQIKVPKVL